MTPVLRPDPDLDSESVYGPQPDSETPLHKLLPLLALAVLALVLLVFNYAVRPLSDLLPTRATQAVSTSSFALAPTGPRLAFVDAAVRGGAPTATGSIYLSTTGGSDRRLLSNHAQAFAGLVFSASGRTLAYLRTFDRVFAGPHANLCLLDVASGRERCPLFAVALPAFSADGHELAYLGKGQALHLRDLRQGRDRILVPEAGVADSSTSLAFSPNGRELAYLSADGRTLLTVSTSAGAPQRIWQAPRPISSLTWTRSGLVVGVGTSLGRLRRSPHGPATYTPLVIARGSGLFAPAGRRLVAGAPIAYALSADGRRLAYLAGDHLHLLQLAAGPATTVAGPKRGWTMRYKTK